MSIAKIISQFENKKSSFVSEICGDLSKPLLALDDYDLVCDSVSYLLSRADSDKESGVNNFLRGVVMADSSDISSLCDLAVKSADPLELKNGINDVLAGSFKQNKKGVVDSLNSLQLSVYTHNGLLNVSNVSSKIKRVANEVGSCIKDKNNSFFDLTASDFGTLYLLNDSPKNPSYMRVIAGSDSYGDVALFTDSIHAKKFGGVSSGRLFFGIR